MADSKQKRQRLRTLETYKYLLSDVIMGIDHHRIQTLDCEFKVWEELFFQGGDNGAQGLQSSQFLVQRSNADTE